MTWTKRDRLAATIAGEQADRPPVALWRHWPDDDENADTLAAAHLRWQREYDWDFVKVSPASSFCLRDWGVEDCWDGGEIGSRRYLRHAITSAEQWAELTPLDARSGMLATQIDTLRRVGRGLAGQTPFLATVFSPLAQAMNLAGPDRVLRDLEHEPALLRRGLEVISESTIRYVEAARETGISGIYLAVRADDSGRLDADRYQEFGAPHDRRVLEAAGAHWLNLVHLHGGRALFRCVIGLEAQILNWHDQECGISLRKGMSHFPRAVCCGVSGHALACSSPETVRGLARSALAQSASRRHILGVGCMTQMSTPGENLRALRDHVDEPGTEQKGEPW